jgi:hypothetical protein
MPLNPLYFIRASHKRTSHIDNKDMSTVTSPTPLPSVIESEGHLNLDAQGILKKILLQESFRGELQEFAKTSDPVHFLKQDSALLGFLYKTMVGDKPDQSVQDLILNLPKVTAVLAKATQKRDSSSIFLSTLSDMLLR